MRKINASFIALGFGAMLALVGCGGEDSVEAFCGIMQDLDDNDPTDGLEEGSAEWFEATNDGIQEAVDAAPDDIRPDLEVFQDAMAELSELVNEDPENLDLTKMEEILSGVEESGNNIDTYMETNCDA